MQSLLCVIFCSLTINKIQKDETWRFLRLRIAPLWITQPCRKSPGCPLENNWGSILSKNLCFLVKQFEIRRGETVCTRYLQVSKMTYPRLIPELMSTLMVSIAQKYSISCWFACPAHHLLFVVLAKLANICHSRTLPLLMKSCGDNGRPFPLSGFSSNTKCLSQDLFYRLWEMKDKNKIGWHLLGKKWYSECQDLKHCCGDFLW